ncbi:MAG: hypothetical protein HFH60_10265 [Lachnospiraceae bacterium]|nr:hypothetical protein [Lachnospiraceae bacterium]
MDLKEFKRMDKQNRTDKLKRIIKGKAKSISDEQLDEIISKIDCTKQFSIISTQSLDSLIKNAFREEKDEEEYSYKVYIKTICGNLKPGLIDVDGQIIMPETNDIFTAFIKTTVINHNDTKNVQNTLFIYVPFLSE